MSDAQPVSPDNQTITNATPADQLAINRFLAQNHLVHRHLDWFSPTEWIGGQPFLIEKHQQQIRSILLAAPEVEQATWVRLFGVSDAELLSDAWKRLLSKAIAMLTPMGISNLCALGSSDWFISLLLQSGFNHINDIVVLQTRAVSPPRITIHTEVEIRPMRVDDLPRVAQIDHSAFEPPWQNALAGLTNAFNQRGIDTVAVKHGKIVGYQISTCLGSHGHLARLAVDPQQQGQHIASALVTDLLEQLNRDNIRHVTVNTQADNAPSLAVYYKFGFHSTGERIPVYQLEI